MTTRRRTHKFTRRRALFTAGGVLLASMGLAGRGAFANTTDVDRAIKKLIGDRNPKPGRIHLSLPGIAENGNNVPISVSVDSSMTRDDFVRAVHLFADGNPNPAVASFYFDPGNGKAEVSTRIRLAKTQNVIAVAELSDGSVYTVTNRVAVTIGGCGG